MIFKKREQYHCIQNSPQLVLCKMYPVYTKSLLIFTVHGKSFYTVVLQLVPFLQVSQPKFCMHFTFVPRRYIRLKSNIIFETV